VSGPRSRARLHERPAFVQAAPVSEHRRLRQQLALALRDGRAAGRQAKERLLRSAGEHDEAMSRRLREIARVLALRQRERDLAVARIDQLSGRDPVQLEQALSPAARLVAGQRRRGPRAVVSPHLMPDAAAVIRRYIDRRADTFIDQRRPCRRGRATTPGP
jgi:hypothetical protein